MIIRSLREVGYDAPVMGGDSYDDPAVIEALKAEGFTILLVEQNARMGLAVADRAYLMRLGRVEAEGPAAEIAAATELKTLYLGGAA